jgi:hypothetical protein
VAGEVELDGRGEDADLAALGIVHEHDLAEPEVGGHGLPVLWRDRHAVQEDA